MNSNGFSEAQSYFQSKDRVLFNASKRAVRADYPIVVPTAKGPDEYFSTLVYSIVSQQISTKVARVLYARLAEHFGTITPHKLSIAADTDLRSVGLSGQKVRYIKTLAQHWNTINVSKLSTASDVEITEQLTRFPGIGIWTAEMFLLFALARPDVFSIGDVGLCKACADLYGLHANDKTEIQRLSQTWAPYRSYAALVLWHQLDGSPVLL